MYFPDLRASNNWPWRTCLCVSGLMESQDWLIWPCLEDWQPIGFLRVWVGGLSICQGSTQETTVAQTTDITSRWRKLIDRWMSQVLDKNHSASCLLLLQGLLSAVAQYCCPVSRWLQPLSTVISYHITIMSGIQTYFEMITPPNNNRNWSLVLVLMTTVCGKIDLKSGLSCYPYQPLQWEPTLGSSSSFLYFWISSMFTMTLGGRFLLLMGRPGWLSARLSKNLIKL